MFQIENVRKAGMGDLHFHTAKGRPVKLVSGNSIKLALDEVNVGLLRVLMSAKGLYKVRADNEDAELMMMEAAEKPPRKPLGSPIVHGSTEPPDFNRGRDVPIEVRDDKNKEEEQKAAEPKPSVKEPEPEPELTPLQKLINAASDLPFGEFRAGARELLGDRFPAGNPGRGAILDELKKLSQE